ncbi:MAG: glycosyltransferase family 2 protein [Acidimicrobiia bacterium]
MTSSIPTFVVVPVKDRLDLTRQLVGQLEAGGGYDALFVLDNGSTDGSADWLRRRPDSTRLVLIEAPSVGIYGLWNLGVRLARSWAASCNIAVLNNDLRIGPGFLHRLSTGLRSAPDLWAVSPNYDGRTHNGVQYVRSTFKGGGLAGFAFMVRGEVFDRLSFDEGFSWWYGEDDFVAGITAAGGRVGVIGEATVEHVGGGSQSVRYTPEVLASIERDRRRMWAKWRHF